MRIVFHQHAIERFIQRFVTGPMPIAEARKLLEDAVDAAVMLKERTIHGQQQALVTCDEHPQLGGKAEACIVVLVLKVDPRTRDHICVTVLPAPEKTWVEKMREEVAEAQQWVASPVVFNSIIDPPTDAAGVPEALTDIERRHLLEDTGKEVLVDMIGALRKRLRGCHLAATKQLGEQKAAYGRKLEVFASDIVALRRLEEYR